MTIMKYIIRTLTVLLYIIKVILLLTVVVPALSYIILDDFEKPFDMVDDVLNWLNNFNK